jgi:flagellar biosynthesis protein FlhA
MIAQLKNITSSSTELFLILGMICILFILFTPIPTELLDFLILLNFSVALLILLVTFYTDKPLSFSTFPSLLLMTTLFRLALNISATRLILDNGDAGKVINAVGLHVVGGNYVIGLVVFFILIVVQYVVVTNGAQRVAEVAARFTLDSLPGKQMSIDADLNMGLIDQEEAKLKRAQLERESNFYGAMDGASKFVKGDAIAGIIIIFINIIGGLTIGIVQLDMGWSEAFRHYTLLTVGDGIVTQIPSLIIAVAAGIIITRAATDTRLGQEITRQFSAHPKTLIIVCIALAGIGLLPGVPLLQIYCIIFILGLAAWISTRITKARNALVESVQSKVNEFSGVSSGEKEEDLYELANVVPFQILVGRNLAQQYLSARSEFDQRLITLRKQLARDLGIILPVLQTKIDNKIEPDNYEIYVQGIRVGEGQLELQSVLAINPGGERAKLEGKSTREPTYGLPALWISHEQVPNAKSSGYTLVEPETVLVTHIQELCKKFAPEFLTRSETEKLIERRRQVMGSLVDDLIPAVLSYSDIQRVLQLLLKEHIPIRNIETILEVLADLGRSLKSPEDLVERIREKLGPLISEQLKDQSGDVHVITLAPELERHLLLAARQKETGVSLLSPTELEMFVTKIAMECEKMMRKSHNPILLCASPIRRILKNMLARTAPQLNVVAINEVAYHARIVSFGVITVETNSHNTEKVV